MNYEIREEKNKVLIWGVRDFHLRHIFECGQAFRWAMQEDKSVVGVAYGKLIHLTFDAGTSLLTIHGATKKDVEEVWYDYFDLGRDYGQIKKRLCTNDSVMETVTFFGSGIRILQQEEWETVVSFLISQNRNVPMIKKSIEELCRNFGKKIGNHQGKVYYAFPSAADLAEKTEADLASCKLGYRSKYIIQTAKMVAQDEQLFQMRKADAKVALEYLMQLCGVGPKVAHCIMLFSLSKYDSFPLDVWMKRAMAYFYDLKEEDTVAMEAFARTSYGDLGGFAQQYIFYYARENAIGKKMGRR